MTEDSPAVPEPSQDTASLVKRLAGPSVTKAGLAKDQTEINRIIAEVSKGSKFYDNEKRKDKELTERIAKILKTKDDVVKLANIPYVLINLAQNEKRKDKELTERIAKILKTKDDVVKLANIQGVEADADRLLEELEAERDLSQTIVHVDMDAFFASVELLLNPDLEGKPFGVGSLKGVLSTASYEARKHGVRSGMAGFVAKKLCPELIVLPVNFEKYSEMSRNVMSIFKEYDPTMIVAGCDEGYLNITKYCSEHGITPEECVREMRQKVHEETKLTASAGIAPNKMLAKICSDKNKPNGQFALPFERDAITAFMRDLSIRKLPGVGRVHERLLDSIGVKTCGDIYAHRAVIWLMDHYFSKIFLYSAYLGIASNVVEPYQRDERKSIGAERTFTPISDHEKLLEKLEEVAVELENDMRDNGWAGKTVTLKYKLNTYQVYTRAKSFNRWITRKEDLFNTGKELLKPELPLCLRLIGLRITKLKDLRASADQGIKRFFQSSTTNTSEPSTKKRKFDNSTDDQLHEFQRLVDEEEADAIKMSEFPDELDNTLEADIRNESPKKPASFAGPTNRDIHIDVGEGQRNNANLAPSTPERDLDEPNTQQCPICAKLLDTGDNAALNAHIDFCLSKDIIKRASASAPPSKSPASSSGARKPRSKVAPEKGNRTLDNWDWKGR